MFEQGQQIDGGYVLIEFADSGGFGEVWRARDTALDSEVAIKFIQKLPQTDEASALIVDEGHKQRELATSAHDGASHIVYVNRAFVSNGDMPSFLDLEWMGGGSLQQRLRRGVRLTQEEILDIATQVAKALACAHAKGIVHCDIKPTNVLVSEDEKVYKLSDFGLARRLSELTKVAWGTPAYMSPEQFRNPDDMGAKSDVYSLGVMLFQAAQGRLPFEGRNRRDYEYKHCQEQAPRIDNPLVASDLRDLIDECLKKQASRRPDATAFLQRIRSIGKYSRDERRGHVRMSALRVKDGYLRMSQDQPIIENREIHLPFVCCPDTGYYLPERLVTNKDYYKFINEPDFRRWSPGAISLAEHDGGYLQHWFMGKPLVGDYDQPICAIPFDAALALAEWLGGQLPSLDELDRLFFGNSNPAIAELYMQKALDAGLPVLQFWCRDAPAESDGDLHAMYRLLPHGSPLSRQLSRVWRPRHYCLPHYLFAMVISPQVAKVVIEKSSNPETRTSSDTGLSGSRSRDDWGYTGTVTG